MKNILLSLLLLASFDRAGAQEMCSCPCPSPSVTPTPVVTPSPSPVPSEDESCRELTFDPISYSNEGWVVLPAASRMIFVSKANAGAVNDPAGAVFKASNLVEGAKLLRKGFPDSLLLARGEVFEGGAGISSVNLGGKSSTELMVIGAYGSGERPKILFRGDFGFLNATTPISNLLIHSLHLSAVRVSNAPEGIRYVANGGKNFILEDMRVEGFLTNLDFDTQEPGYQNLVVRRSQILDAYSMTDAHSQGLYMDRVKGALIEENVFDHNGWQNRSGGKGVATMFNHNLYLQTLNKCVTFRKNVSMRASATGLQMRAGGMVEDNFFYLNPIQLTYGLVDGGSVQLKHIPLGVSGSLSRNVFLKGTDITPTLLRSGVVQVANLSKLRMEQNIVAHHVRGPVQAQGYHLKSTMGLGIHNLLFQNNIAYDVGQKLLVEGSVFGSVIVKSDGAGGAGVWLNGSLAISPAASGIASSLAPFNLLDSGTKLVGNVFQLGANDFLAKPSFLNPALSLSSWQTAAVKFKDPLRVVDDFQGMGSEVAFIAYLREHSFEVKWSAPLLNAFIREGYVIP